MKIRKSLLAPLIILGTIISLGSMTLSLVNFKYLYLILKDDGGKLGGLEEVPKIYTKEKTFHDYYVEYERRGETGENQAALITIFQEHIQDLVTPEIKELTEEYLAAVLNNDEEKFKQLSMNDEKLILYHHGNSLDGELGRMHLYYFSYLLASKQKDCEKKNILNSNCRLQEIFDKNLAALSKLTEQK